MNFAFLHLALNHIPIISLPIFLGILVWGRFQKQNDIIQLALVGLILGAFFSIPVYLTGEPAEELIEDMQGVHEGDIEHHEDAAQLALIASIVTGIAAFLCFISPRIKLNENLGLNLLTLLCIFAIALFLWTAHLGGQIRHPELKSKDTTAIPDRD